ncbi:MAG: SAM-dependent chlorinase/fluorinase, partial [Leptolyngbya sp. SIO1D8]|nr:SAM-dependent chlorinase/fluorinase [Leptolyngbya sp. SIO1D8]
RQPWKLTLDTTEIPLGHTYGTVKPGEALALVGSHGWLEIAINGGSAQQRFRLVVGDIVRLEADG